MQAVELEVTEARLSSRGHLSSGTFQLWVDKGSLPFAPGRASCVCHVTASSCPQEAPLGGELALKGLLHSQAQARGT